MRYYIADCHFFHRSLLTSMDMRPFSSVEEMNETMIEKWNRKVRKNDEVVILGDLSLGSGAETDSVVKRLNGRLCLIRGNHDGRYLNSADFDASRFEWVKDYAELHDNKKKICLMHYPVFCYNRQNSLNALGEPLSYMLFGHIHNTYDQVLVDSFISQTRSSKRLLAHHDSETSIPCQMINCFCMYSDYTPLSLGEWGECDRKRREALGLESPLPLYI